MGPRVYHLIAISGLVVVGGLLCALHQFISGDLGGVFGVIILWLVGAAGMAWYVVGGLKVIYDGLDKLEPIRAGAATISWALKAYLEVGPGLWIGLVADHPWLISGSMLLVYLLIGWLNDVVPSNPRVVIRPGSNMAYLYRAINAAAPWLTGTAAGVIVRAWLSW